MVENGALSHKIDYLTIFKEYLNFGNHQNCITGSGASLVEGLRSIGPLHVVSMHTLKKSLEILCFYNRILLGINFWHKLLRNYLIHWFTHAFLQYCQNIITLKPFKLESWNFERMFSPHHMSCVTCHVSRVIRHMSPFFVFFLQKKR